MSILIKNGNVVKQNEIIKADILIEGTRIIKIAENIDIDDSCNIIDAEGLTILAGFIDMHCHLREPGLEYKEDIDSGTASALEGGFTSVACMPNTVPPIDNAALVKYVIDRSLEVGNSKVYPIGCITKGQQGKELAEMFKMKKAGAIAVSDDGHSVMNSGLMKLALEYAKGLDMLIISHCEDDELSEGGVVNEGFNATIAGLKGISRASEECMVSRDIILAETAKAKIHIAHVSTKGSVELVRNAKRRGVKVTCETCPHYFCATDEEILGYNTNSKINPPLREQSDLDAIIEGLKDGTIDAIATDHAPHHRDEKNVEYNLAPFGTVGFETAFSLAYTYLVETGVMDLTDLSKLMSKNPAKILGLKNTGVIEEGFIADLAMVDLNSRFNIDSSRFISKGKNSLFDNWKVTGKVIKVLVDGQEKELRNYDR